MVRVTSGILAALLAPLGILLALDDLRRNLTSVLATLGIAALFLYVAARPDALPFLDDPAVPDDS